MSAVETTHSNGILLEQPKQSRTLCSNSARQRDDCNKMAQVAATTSLLSPEDW